MVGFSFFLLNSEGVTLLFVGAGRIVFWVVSDKIKKISPEEFDMVFGGLSDGDGGQIIENRRPMDSFPKNQEKLSKVNECSLE